MMMSFAVGRCPGPCRGLKPEHHRSHDTEHRQGNSPRIDPHRIRMAHNTRQRTKIQSAARPEHFMAFGMYGPPFDYQMPTPGE
jgi:hypothetical protein